VRDAGGGRMLVPMSDQWLHVAIDVNVAEDQIHGNVCAGDGEPKQFYGWLGLIGELDEMLGSQRSAEEEVR